MAPPNGWMRQRLDTDTNVTDHLSYDYLEEDGVEFAIAPTRP
ncbi:MAG: hypothetical protein R6U67_14640 [Sodalinema sp.]